MAEFDFTNAENPRRSGAYGFSRREVVALTAVIIVSLGIVLYRWIDRNALADAPPWVVETVLVETPATQTAAGDRSSDSALKSMRRVLPQTAKQSISINSATEAEIARLPGIGPVLAGRIVAERERNGPFRNSADLQRVSGIGPHKAQTLVGWLHFDADSTTTQEAP